MGTAPPGVAGPRAQRYGRTGLAVISVTALLLTGGPLGPTPATAAVAGVVVGDGPRLAVVVRADGPADTRAAQLAVRAAGGTVGRPLDLINGFVAAVPADAVAPVRRAAGVAAVTVDASVRLTSEEWEDDEDSQSSVAEVTDSAGANQAWASPSSGTGTAGKLTGAGVGVALIDSGVAPVDGINQPGKVIQGPDLSFESQNPQLRRLDTYGHGTHLAGIIAGRDTTTPTGAVPFRGVAPGAHVLSLKVAASDGGTDVSQVIAAIDWVVQHRNDQGLNIRVLNLSFGTDSTQHQQLDPLSYAVEMAWRKGIVVVVAVGNDGAAQTRVTMPAANPYVIAVGAADPNGTVDRADDRVADFSGHGDASRHADLVAAGRSIVSLRTPGSFVDVHHPEARLTDNERERFIRGSGTSQAAAVVSGATALLLEQRPGLTPDQVKRLLTGTAQPLAGPVVATGAGQLDIARAAATATPGGAVQRHGAALGTGSLELSRGTAHVTDLTTGTELTGERDIFGSAWDPQRWTVAAAQARAWSGGTWNGRTWAGGGWSGSGAARVWSSVNWSGRNWAGTPWKLMVNGQHANTATWTARTWSARTWSARTWSARTWSARTWSARTWSGASWPGSP
ncbi:MAG TPA: S8 family serine peptidase [Catenuloplanes sp.]